MNGRIRDPLRVRKNREANRFEAAGQYARCGRTVTPGKKIPRPSQAGGIL
jgi:hypothetical protein